MEATQEWSRATSAARLPPRPSLGRDIVVIGASAGGVEAISHLLERLTSDFPGSLFVVLHIAPNAPSALAQILDRSTELHAITAEDGKPIEHGRVYVAPPNRHLLVSAGHVHLDGGPREHGHRPAIDPLFRTAAEFYGPRAVGVLLSGNLDDGVVGLACLKRRGGVSLVQSPDEALFPSLPQAAAEIVSPDAVLPVRELAVQLERLARVPLDDQPLSRESAEGSGQPPDGDNPHARRDRSGPQLTCPECGGALVEEVQEGEPIHFRCPLGHAFAEHSLVALQGDALESALWESIRRLEERANLLGRLGDQMRSRGSHVDAMAYAQKAQDSLIRARLIRRAVLASAVEDLDRQSEGGNSG